jgi:hypothetical protein
MFEAFAAEAAGTAAAEQSSGGHWQLALIVAAIGFLGLFARWRKSRMPVVHTAREIRERDTDPGRYRDAADKALVELLETSRALNAQVDTKIRVLNRLVKDAESCAARLESMLADARAVRELPSAASAPAPVPESAAEPPPPQPDERKFMSDLHERIHRLRAEGRDSAEIAKATNLSTTEVEFIVKTLG